MPILDARRLHAEMLPVSIARENDFGEVTHSPGLAAFVTPEIAARCAADDGAAARREAAVGELVVLDAENNAVWSGMSPSAYPAPLLLRAGAGDDAPSVWLGDSLIGAVSTLRGYRAAQEAPAPAPALPGAGEQPSAAAQAVVPADVGVIDRWISMIGDQARHVASHPDEFPSAMQAGALSLNLVNSYGPDAGEPPVSVDALVRLNRAAMARETIALFNPDHPDAAVKPRALETILDEASGGAGVNLRAGATWRPGASVAVLPERMANDRLTREVFGAMTSTPIETLRATPIDAALAERIRGSLREDGSAMNAEWSGAVRDKLDEVFGRRMGAYRAEVEAFRKDGADMLFVSDMQGQYLYAWPSEDTHPVATVRGEHAPAVPANIPDEAEVARLEGVARDLAVADDPELDADHDLDAPGY